MMRLLAVLVALAACAYLYATEPSAEGQTPDATEAPCPDTGQDGYDLNPCPQPIDCPPGSQVNGPYLPAECVCEDGSVAAMISDDGSTTFVRPCLIPPTTIGDPTEPVPFDDGDPAYPLDELVPEAQPAEPIAGDPAFTG